MSDYFNLNQGVQQIKEKHPLLKKLLTRKNILIGLTILALPLLIGVVLVQQEIRSKAFDPQLVSENKLFEADGSIPSNGYIVEFKSNSVSRSMSGRIGTENREELGNSLRNARESLLREQQSAKNDILSRAGKRSFDSIKNKEGDKKLKLLAEYTNVFSGIAVDGDKDQIEKIKESPYVKAVYPNIKVQASLMDSVSMIGADKIWQTVKDKYDGSPVTGKGINIAILDSGIDYTHPDLGNSAMEERSLQKISNKPFRNYFNFDSSISYNQNRIAYISDRDKVSIYSFSSGETQDIDLNTPDMQDPEAYNLLLAGDNLFYVSLSLQAVNLNLKNINTGEVKKISDLGLVTRQSEEYLDHYASVISKYSFSNGKLYYERQIGGDSIVFNVYSYDLATGIETKLLEDSDFVRYPKVQGNKMVYSVYDPSNYVYTKNVLRDLDTGSETNLADLPEVGPVIDFKEDLILYKAYGTYGTYYLYNLENKEIKKLTYQGNEDINSVIGQTIESSVTFGFNLKKGMIGDGVIFFQKNSYASQLVAYDLAKNQYFLINLKNFSGSVGGEGKKICFAAKFDSQIYCHTYDSTSNYPLPAQTYNAKVKGGFNFVDSSPDALDDFGHGTHVAEIVAGNGTLKGVAPDANLYSYKVLNSGGGGSMSNIIWAIDTAVQTLFDSDFTNDIRIINLSLGAVCGKNYSEYCGPNDPLSRAVDNAVDNGVVVIIAAGNSGRDGFLISTPGTSGKAITVGAIDKDKKIADFSSRGPVKWNGEDLKKPDVVAPGVSICSAQLFGLAYGDYKCLNSNHISLSGTSMAAPHVAGLAALILQAHPEWTPQKVKDAIKNNADDLGLSVDEQGAGLVNAQKIFADLLVTPTVTSSYQTLKINSSADSHIREDQPGKNYGTLSILQTDSSPNTITLIKFNLSSLKGKTVKSAKLVLTVNQSSTASQTLRKMDDKFWTEGKVTYNNRPKNVSVITKFSLPKSKTSLDVTSAVNLNKEENITFGITASSDKVSRFYSNQASNASRRPQLIIEYQ